MKKLKATRRMIAEDVSKGNKKMMSEQLLKKWFLSATTCGVMLTSL